jgi:acetyl-CoA carboxylase biotin carboxyl carrier protein
MAEPGKTKAKAEDRQAQDSPMRVDTAMVSKLAELLTTNELNEIEVNDGDRRIRVVRHQEFPEGLGFVGNNTMAQHPDPHAPIKPAVGGAAAPAEEVSGETVKSPMVGTAFMSAEPGAEPFIAVGAAVKAGDTLLIIEAMKVMNPITAPNGGVVKKIMVADAQPVEFDQPLVIIG